MYIMDFNILIILFIIILYIIMSFFEWFVHYYGMHNNGNISKLLHINDNNDAVFIIDNFNILLTIS